MKDEILIFSSTDNETLSMKCFKSSFVNEILKVAFTNSSEEERQEFIQYFFENEKIYNEDLFKEFFFKHVIKSFYLYSKQSQKKMEIDFESIKNTLKNNIMIYQYVIPVKNAFCNFPLGYYTIPAPSTVVSIVWCFDKHPHLDKIKVKLGLYYKVNI